MDLRDAYMKDPARAKDMIVMISRDPEDIARMSTKRKWESCMNPGHYRFKRHVTADLQEGTAIAYLLKPDDVHAVAPMARIALKPYRNEAGDVLMVPNRTFGLAKTSFADFVRSVADTYVNEGKLGVFKLHNDLGSDDLASEVERLPEAVLSQRLRWSRMWRLVNRSEPCLTVPLPNEGCALPSNQETSQSAVMAIRSLFQPCSARELSARLKTALEQGDLIPFAGMVEWKLEAEDLERIWEGRSESLDTMGPDVLNLMNGTAIADDWDTPVALSISDPVAA